jgi:1-acyl-sn-glycerol-3-phosphate acyltransferase
MWTSTAASGFGDRMIMLGALALLGGMAAGVDATSTQSSTQFWFFLPYLVFSTLGGWLADRMPRKWLLLICDQSRGLILLWSWWRLGQASGPAAIPESAYWRVYAILMAIGVFAAIFNPTRGAITPQIIPREKLPAANAVILVINIIASLIGLKAGTALIHQDDVTTVRTGLLMGSLFYLVSGWFFAFLKPVHGSSAHESIGDPVPVGETSRYMLKHRRVIQLVLINAVIWPCAALVTSGLFGVGKMQHHLIGQELGAYYANTNSALGAGMLVGAAAVAIIATRREGPLVYLGAFSGAGLAIALLVIAPWKPANYLACFGVGFCGGIAIIATAALLQSISPNRIRGRIMGVNSALNTTLSVVVYFAVWRLPDADRNIVWVMAVLGPLLTIVGVTLLVRSSRVGPMATGALNLMWRIGRLFLLVVHRARFIGKHHVPPTGPVILAANHTTGLDPFLMQAPLRRLVKWVMLTSYQYRVMNFLWRRIDAIALDKDASDLGKLRRIIQALKEGQVVGLFPEGRLQRDQRELAPFEPGIGMIAKRSGATIVPVWIEGTPVKRSMFWHFLWPSRSTVIYGKPYRPDERWNHEQIAEDLRRRMMELAQRLK